jgi:hypothetical protein
LWRRAVSRVHAALPGGVEALFGSLVWAALMGASAWLAGAAAGKSIRGSLSAEIVTFSIGGLAALSPGLFLFRLLGPGKGHGQRFALIFLSLAAATALCTWLTFAVFFRAYYAQWHDDFLTGDWLREQIFTMASAGYQFAVLGLRSFLPLGLPALFLASWHISKKPV